VTDLSEGPKRSTSHLEPGSEFAGYVVERVVDRGGMGVVYKAVDPDLDRQIALKIIAPEHAMNETAVARFKAECRLAASLEHPNIVPIHRGGEFEGVLYLAMRFVPGTTLRAVIDGGPMDLALVSDIVSQVAGALDAAHEAGLVHRDVKPANILISGPPGKPHVFLTDFGLTKRLGSANEALTRDGGWVGTPDYVAPEQIQGHKVDRRADVYSLGCVLFEMLTGRVAYAHDSDMAKLWAHVQDPPPLPSTVVPELADYFDDIVARATAKDPEHRYATAGALAAVVRRAVTQQESERRSADAAAAAPIIDLPDATRDDETFVTGPPPPPRGATPPPPPPRAATPAPPPPPPRGTGAAVPVAMQDDGGPSLRRGTGDREGSSSGDGGGGGVRRRAKPLAALAVLLIAAVVAAVVLGGGGSDGAKPVGQAVDGKLTPVPTNRVTGSGDAVMRLHNNTLTVSIDSTGLLNGAPHALHIHAGGKGTCPDSSVAAQHNGHLSIATHAGVPFYGPPVKALTTRGDTSVKSIVAFSRYPTTSDVAYRRTIRLTPIVASYIREDNAVLVVHGIDYNHNGVYDGVLERSDLDRSLTGESTAPALCGPLVADKATAEDNKSTARVPDMVFTASLSRTEPDETSPFYCPLHLGSRDA
jgi:serine/threonine protein kinase